MQKVTNLPLFLYLNDFRLGAETYNYKKLSKEDIANGVKGQGKLIDVVYDCVGSQNLEIV